MNPYLTNEEAIEVFKAVKVSEESVRHQYSIQQEDRAYVAIEVAPECKAKYGYGDGREQILKDTVKLEGHSVEYEIDGEVYSYYEYDSVEYIHIGDRFYHLPFEPDKKKGSVRSIAFKMLLDNSSEEAAGKIKELIQDYVDEQKENNQHSADDYDWIDDED